MGTVCDENFSVDADDEVKKLQDLVKKLEKQNQILKNRQNDNDENQKVLRNGTIDTNNDGAVPKITQIDNLKAKTKGKTALDDIDLLDLNEENKEESEDSWLFASPKSSGKSRVSPYKWVRQDLEKRTPEVENIRKSLVFRLDDVTKMVRSPSASFSSEQSPSPRKNASTSQYRNEVDGETPRPRRNASGLENRNYSNGQMFENDEGSKINTNTFRIKKRPVFASLANNQNHAGPERSRESSDSSPRTGSVGSPRQAVDTSNESDFNSHRDAADRVRDIHNLLVDTRDRNGNASKSEAFGNTITISRQSSTDNSLDSPREGGEYNKLTDVVDVQVLARMQEDSLRKSMTSPAQFNQKKALSRSMNSGYGSNRSSPGRTDMMQYSQHVQRSNPSLGSLSSHSDSPSDSPYGSSQQLDPSEEANDGLRRSMPNLAKTMPMSLPSHPSDPELNETPTINTNTFTRKKPGGTGSAMSRYGSGGLAARSPAQGLNGTYHRTQSPSGAVTPRGSGMVQPRGANQQRQTSPQRAYNVRNVSPVRPRQARNVSPVNSPSQARNVSPVRPRQARNVSPVDSGPVRRRGQSPGRTLGDRPNSPLSTFQARNVSPVGAPSPQRSGLRSPQSAGSAYARTPGQSVNTSMSRTFSGNSLRTPQTQYDSSERTMSPQRAAPGSSGVGMGARTMSSPGRTGLPGPRSTAIPRAGSSSKLPAPRKSAIPASRRAALFGNRGSNETDWKDGCY